MRKSRRVYRPFANDVDAYIPELWAAAGLVQVEENMVAARLVHRDFEKVLANYGDIVNTRRPAEFTAKRKARGSDITIQDATATNVPVKLNQHLHTSFLVHDTDSAKSFKSLEDEFIVPAARSLARKADLIVLAQTNRLMGNMGGDLATAAGRTSVLQTREKLEQDKIPQGRTLLINPAVQTGLLGLAEWVDFDKVGDTAALRTASLGVKFGINIWMAQNVPLISDTYQPTIVTGAVNNAAGYSAGDTVITVDGFTGVAVTVGKWITIVGDSRPRQVAAKAETSGNTTQITLATALSAAVLDNAVIKVYGGANTKVNLAAGYASGYEELIAYDGAGSGKKPQVGQLVTFGTTTTIYTVIEQNDGSSGAGTILLDRPLEAALADDDVINLGPSGSFCPMFHRDAISFVVRPLGKPRGGGANVGVVMDERIGGALRASLCYDQYKQATVVTLDMLCGITMLDATFGGVMLSNNAINS